MVIDPSIVDPSVTPGPSFDSKNRVWHKWLIGIVAAAAIAVGSNVAGRVIHQKFFSDELSAEQKSEVRVITEVVTVENTKYFEEARNTERQLASKVQETIMLNNKLAQMEQEANRITASLSRSQTEITLLRNKDVLTLLNAAINDYKLRINLCKGIMRRNADAVRLVEDELLTLNQKISEYQKSGNIDTRNTEIATAVSNYQNAKAASDKVKA